MKSIRMKLFLIFTIFLSFFVLLSILMNSQFLENYYIHRNETIMYDTYEYINENYSTDASDLNDLLIDLDRSKGIHSYIIANDLTIKYDSFPQNNKRTPQKMIEKNIADYILSNIETLETEYIYDTIEIREYGLKDVQFIIRLETDEILILRKSVSIINENSAIANEFFIYLGLLTIILGSLFMFFFSKRITKPIVDLNHIAKSISNLNFNKKYEVRSIDEIGTLGASINLISEELDKSMSELVEANEKLKEDIERKKEIDNMRKDFVSSVSHELKTPIGLIKGYAEGLKYSIASSPEKRNKYCNIIISETDKMNNLVKDLLDLSYVESKGFTIEKTVFNISILINKVIEKHLTNLNDKNIEIKTEIEKDYLVAADYLRIEQVVENYLTNAINHVDTHKDICIKVQKYDSKIRVSIINSGENIPETEIDNIWKSFYKIDKARTRKYGGSGLGLSIVKAIMDLHGGSYSATNLEEAVEFWFELDIIDTKNK